MFFPREGERGYCGSKGAIQSGLRERIETQSEREREREREGGGVKSYFIKPESNNVLQMPALLFLTTCDYQAEQFELS